MKRRTWDITYCAFWIVVGLSASVWLLTTGQGIAASVFFFFWGAACMSVYETYWGSGRLLDDLIANFHELLVKHAQALDDYTLAVTAAMHWRQRALRDAPAEVVPEDSVIQ